MGEQEHKRTCRLRDYGYRKRYQNLSFQRWCTYKEWQGQDMVMENGKVKPTTGEAYWH